MHRICVVKRIGYRNSFQTRLVADVSEQTGQTLIRCQFGMNPWVKAFMTVWLAGATIGSMFVQGASFLLPVFGGCLLAFGHYSAMNEKPFLIGLLKDVLSARETAAK